MARLNAEDAGLDEDAMIAEYLASQVEDFECDPDADMVPQEWPKGRGSKLLDQTLCVHLCNHLYLCFSLPAAVFNKPELSYNNYQ